jgi:hypothetical protein
MAKGLISVVCFLTFFPAAAQIAEPLFFRERVHDFGEVLEQKGPVVHEFVFTNNGSRPITILSVQASCGCTTPGWTQEPVLPGKSGYIKASFDPKGRPGYFNKTLTVMTDWNRTPIQLQIKGNVVDKISLKSETLTVASGSLRTRYSSFNMGKVYINKEPVAMEFAVMNGGKKPLEISEVKTPAHIRASAPSSLEPGEMNVLKIQYDAKAKGHYGFHVDNLELVTNDEVQPVKTFPVYATLEEFFPMPAADELAKAPVLMFEKQDIDFSRVKAGTIVEQSLAFQNKGKKNLELRYVQSNCSCLEATLSKQVLKPGESAMLSLKFKTEGRSGTQNKAVTIYSNDLRNPVQRITITGYIED